VGRRHPAEDVPGQRGKAVVRGHEGRSVGRANRDATSGRGRGAPLGPRLGAARGDVEPFDDGQVYADRQVADAVGQ
jgi:hypothetical protein